MVLLVLENKLIKLIIKTKKIPFDGGGGGGAGGLSE